MIKSRDHDLAKWRLGSGHRQKKTQKINKSRAEQELRSAHGRAVNYFKSKTSSLLGNFVELCQLCKTTFTRAPKQRYCAKQKSEHPSVLQEMLLICRHPDLIMSFSHQAATLVLKLLICKQIEAKCHLFLSFLTRNHYITMWFPVLLYSVYKRKSISKHGRESRQVFKMVYRLPWTLRKPYKERFARNTLENSYIWLRYRERTCKLAKCFFFACIISEKRR